MFSYLTGAAKKAVSRRGKEPHKFRSASLPLPRRPAPRPSSRKKANNDGRIWPTPPTLPPTLRRLTLAAPSYRPPPAGST